MDNSQRLVCGHEIDAYMADIGRLRVRGRGGGGEGLQEAEVIRG